jgi:hypothetical protein
MVWSNSIRTASYPRLTMLRVYLDQNKWIDLGRAINGNPEGAPFKQVAVAIGTAVDHGQASFPLSAAHAFETAKRRNAVQRHQLAATMMAVSRNHAISPHWELLPPELDRALQRRFGKPDSPLPLQPFGFGRQHRSGRHALAESSGLRGQLGEANPGLSDRELTDLIDWILLAGPPVDLPVVGIDLPPVEPAQNFAKDQNKTVELFLAHQLEKDKRRGTVVMMEVRDMFEQLDEARARAGIAWEELLKLGADDWADFLLDLPSRAPGLELMWRQHDNTQTTWHPNDMTDIGYLSAAVAYCDVVVTERKWAAMLNNSGVARRFGTTVISNLADLSELLVTQSVAA